MYVSITYQLPDVRKKTTQQKRNNSRMTMFTEDSHNTSPLSTSSQKKTPRHGTLSKLSNVLDNISKQNCYQVYQ